MAPRPVQANLPPGLRWRRAWCRAAPHASRAPSASLRDRCATLDPRASAAPGRPASRAGHGPALRARGATEGRSHTHDRGVGATTAEYGRERAEPAIMRPGKAKPRDSNPAGARVRDRGLRTQQRPTYAASPAAGGPGGEAPPAGGLGAWPPEDADERGRRSAKREQTSPPREGDPAHPPEPVDPCCLPALGEFTGWTPRGVRGRVYGRGVGRAVGGPAMLRSGGFA